MADFFQEDDEDKTCLLCSNAYSGEIHQHLFSGCLAPCLLGCEELTPAELSMLHHLSTTEHMSIHLAGLANKISKLRDEKKKSADATSINCNSVASFNKTQGITERYMRTSNILNKIVGSRGEPVISLFRSDTATEKNRSKLKELFLATSTEFQRVYERDVVIKEPLINKISSLNIRLDYLKISPVNTTRAKNNIKGLRKKSFIGKYIWNIPNIGAIFAGRFFPIYSRMFLTSHYGYNMYCKLYVNGIGDATGISISIFTALNKGPVDELLQWPFNKLVKISIINQRTHQLDYSRIFKPDLSLDCYAKPGENESRGAGAIYFAPSLAIYNSYQHYIVNDTMCISIEVADSFDGADEHRIQLAEEEPTPDVPSVLPSSSSGGTSSAESQ